MVFYNLLKILFQMSFYYTEDSIFPDIASCFQNTDDSIFKWYSVIDYFVLWMTSFSNGILLSTDDEILL